MMNQVSALLNNNQVTLQCSDHYQPGHILEQLYSLRGHLYIYADYFLK